MPTNEPLLPSWWHAATHKTTSATPPALLNKIIHSAKLPDPIAVADTLANKGFCIIDNFLGASAATASVLAGIQALDTAGRLRLGKIQNALKQAENTESRTDRIGFIPSPIGPPPKTAATTAAASSTAPPTIPTADCADALLAYTRAADFMRTQLTQHEALVKRIGGGLDDCNFMCACYPGGGARYVKHRDALPYKAGRKLTVIYYLNAQWQKGHGGELRIWPTDETEDEDAVIIEPLADRLVLFISSLEHEVLPAWRPRFALTTWMFNKRDTALEVFAEEMRQRKAQGKFNTQALLAALDADSSEDDDEKEDEEEEEGVGKNSAMKVMMMLMQRKQAKAKAEAAANKKALHDANGKAAEPVAA